jgi:hypothetical protein
MVMRAGILTVKRTQNKKKNQETIMATKQIRIRVSETVFKELQEISDIANVDLSRLIRYYTYEKLQEFRIKRSGAYEPSFWQDATTWVKFKDAVMQMKALPTSDREAIEQDVIDTERIVAELNAE